MKLIKSIYDLVTLATDKGLTTYWSDAQIMNAVYQAEMPLYRELVQEFAKTKKIRNEILPFQKRGSIVIVNRIGSLPNDFDTEIDLWCTVNGIDRQLTPLEAGMFKKRLTDPIDPGTDPNYMYYNIYNDGGNKIEVSAQVTPIAISYFKPPVLPVYATTLSGGVPVYNDGGSTDVEWGVTMHDVIVRNSLGILGLAIRDGQVQRAGQETTPKEATLQ